MKDRRDHYYQVQSIAYGSKEIDQKRALSAESNENPYLFSIQILDKLKSENKPELKKVVYELQKIVGFIRNESNFGEEDSRTLYCESQIQQQLEKLSNELSDFSLDENRDRTSAVSRMLKCCKEVSIRLKIRAERMKK